MSTEPDLTDPRRALLLELKAQEWASWKHHPVTAAYLVFLGDQVENWRAAVTDMWETGHLDALADNPSMNPNVLRGRVLALRELLELELDAIQGFYGVEAEAPQQGTDDGTAAT